MKEEWLKHIHDRMADFEADEPEGLWDNILQNRQKPMALRPIMPLWAKRITGIAAMLAIVLAASMLFMVTNDDIDNSHFSQQPATGTCQADQNKLLSQTSYDTPDMPSPLSAWQEPAKLHRNATPDVKPTESIDENGRNGNSWQEQSGRTVPETHENSGANQSESPVPPLPRVSDNQSGDDIYNKKRRPAIKRRDYEARRLSLGLFTSGSPNSSSNRVEHGIAMTGVLGADKAAWEDKPMLGLLLFNQGLDVVTEVKHRLPFRTGLSFAYRINDRLSVESGIIYSRLTSDLKYGSESHYISGRQTLHYIGLPVNAKYRVVSWNSFDLYASAGVLAEKCVSGKIEKDIILDNQMSESEREDATVKPLQWSVNASAGVQFNINRAIGIYAEPGISCYIDNGSPVKTIYSDRPLNFNLNIGLRLSLGHN